MALTKHERNVYTFAGGINTDSSLLTFPENQSTSEINYNILTDGSRRRRLGLAPEDPDNTGLTYATDISTYVDDITDVGRYQVFEWKNAGSATNEDFLVFRVGPALYVFRDGVSQPSSDPIGIVDLTTEIISTAPASALYSGDMDATSGRGKLVITHKYLDPLYLEWDANASLVTINKIVVKERDFVGKEDGVGDSVKPLTLTDEHEYNLLNRGWKQADIAAYFASKAAYPSKNMIPWLGYRRVTTASVAEQDWTKSFSPDKLVAELFQDGSAPMGKYILNTFGGDVVVEKTNPIEITNVTYSGTVPGSTVTVTITTASAHGLIAGNVAYLDDTRQGYIKNDGSFTASYIDFSGLQTLAAAPLATTFTFTVTWPTDFGLATSGGLVKGTFYKDYITNLVDSAVGRFQTCEFYAGRMWYAGVANSILGTRIYFSQTIESDSQFGKCYQKADPTDERISILVAADGGYIDIPDAEEVVNLVTYSGSLLVFARSGVWQITGPDGYFLANNYVVRRISDVGCVSRGSVVVAETVPLFWSENSIYAVALDDNSGFLSVKNISVNRIENFLLDITYSNKVDSYGVYDDTNKKVYWAYRTETATPVGLFDHMLVFDVRYNAFYVYEFGTTGGVVGATTGIPCAPHVIKKTALTDPFRMLYVKQDTPNAVLPTLYVGEFRDTSFKDFNTSLPDAFIVTGFDTSASLNRDGSLAYDAGRRKLGSKIIVFSKKTETGYELSGSDYVPVGESSTKLQARWNWADNSSAGKWGSEYEVYRHPRMYQPVDENDTYDDGAPLVVTKNKMRGSGRSLHMRFRAGTKDNGDGYDSHIVGWQLMTGIKTEL